MNTNKNLEDKPSSQKQQKITTILNYFKEIRNTLEVFPDFPEVLFIRDATRKIRPIISEPELQEHLKETSINEMLKSIEDVISFLRRPYDSEEKETALDLAYFFNIFIKNLPLDNLNKVDYRILKKIKDTAASFDKDTPQKKEGDIEKLNDKLAVEVSKRKELEEKLEIVLQEAHKIKKEAEDKIQKAENLLATEGAAKIVTDYAKSATKNDVKSRWLFHFAMLLLVAGGIIMCIIMYPYITDAKSVQLESFLFKITVYIPFLIPALYLLHESKAHQNESFRLRDISLKTVAIPLYLENIANLAERETTQLKLAEQIFAPSIHKFEHNEEMLKKCLDFAQNIAKAKTGK